MLHPLPLVVRRNCATGDSFNLWVFLFCKCQKLQHILNFVLVCHSVHQTLCPKQYCLLHFDQFQKC